MNTSYENWHNYIVSQISIYKTKRSSKRKDSEYIWDWYNSVTRTRPLVYIKTIVKWIIRYSSEQRWFDINSELLFTTRQVLDDEYSKMQFDLYILLKVVGQERFYFPRNYFDEFISILSEDEFTFDLPKNYLHNRYIKIQAELYPVLRGVLNMNLVGIGDKEETLSGIPEDVIKITSGGNALNNYEITTIDNYVAKNKIQKIDYIKMDIEGAEVAALSGGSASISKFKPRLAISGCHKDVDLWEIPLLIKKINPKYKVYYEHYLPINWEACIYAA